MAEFAPEVVRLFGGESPAPPHPQQKIEPIISGGCICSEPAAKFPE
jgi:hypothetical protein